MGVGSDKCQLNVHLHFQPDRRGALMKDIPKGYLAVLVGRGEEQRRFVIPVIYVNHPLFMKLLKEAEEEYGFDQKGPIIIPCRVDQFLSVQCMIDKEKAAAGTAVHTHQHHHHHHHLHHHLPVWCFRD